MKVVGAILFQILVLGAALDAKFLVLMWRDSLGGKPYREFVLSTERTVENRFRLGLVKLQFLEAFEGLLWIKVVAVHRVSPS